MKVLRICTFLLMGTAILLWSAEAFSFDEARWRKTVEGQRVEALYAPHFADGKYFNPWLPQERNRFWQFLKWRLSKKANYTEEEEAFRPKFVLKLRERITDLDDTRDFIAWIGHGTFLMRLQGEFWLTDPIFSPRALLPKRVTPPALTAEDLKALTDRVHVIISHNHYDHLDADSIRSLPAQSVIYVPRGLGKLVSSLHDGTVRELDWWEDVYLPGGTKLVCLPAQHWSRRIGQATNSTLWTSYMVVTPETTVYYGADSGYFVGYREIGRRFPGITYALLPLTAYHPRWFMHYAHINAAEALDAFSDLGAEYFIPTQWGTFRLGDNPPGYPVLDLRRVMKTRGIDPSPFIIMDLGQIRKID